MTEVTGDLSTKPLDQRPVFGPEARLVAARLGRAVAVSLFVVALVSAALLLLFSRRPAWWSAYISAVMISLVAVVFSLPVVIWGLFGTIYRVVAGYLIAMVLRGVVTVAGLAIVVWAGRYPPIPTLLILAPLYFAQLAAECIVLARAMSTHQNV